MDKKRERMKHIPCEHCGTVGQHHCSAGSGKESGVWMSKMREKAAEIEKCANDALESAFSQKKRFENEAVNWADLHVFNVTRCIPCLGDLAGEDPHWLVEFEEASPSSEDLRDHVHSALKAKFPSDQFVVRCEW